MTTTQTPIGSGFGAESTAAEVLDGVDLTGKLVLVTGGYSGLGLETTRVLVAAGASVVVPARRPDVARQALDGTENVEVAELDLADLDSVQEFAEEFLASGRTLDLLILNAAVMACPHEVVGGGWEKQFATNHLGHFALVNRLWPAIADGARVIAVSSGAHQIEGIRWDDLHFEADGYDRWKAYGQSKTANALFALHLDTLGDPCGISAFSLDPGAIRTPLQRHFTEDEMRELGWLDEDGKEMDWFKTVPQGAATQVWGATSPALAAHGGQYLRDCDIAKRADVKEYATDREAAARLWALSAEMTGVDAFAG